VTTAEVLPDVDPEAPTAGQWRAAQDVAASDRWFDAAAEAGVVGDVRVYHGG
jgi:hypothetical protein